ncbi:MAG: hypothetical protein HY898_09840 [Deltaproteobacteria bacterium]|nr:hypothetical protein [Deltaproteobacteria bacterium]
MHTIAYEARVEVSRQGTAKIDHMMRIKVGGGPLRTFDLKIADRNVVLPEEAWLVNAREGITAAVPIPVHLDQRPDGDLRVDIDGKRGVGRGVYELRFSYTIDLLRQDAVALDGTMLRLVWTSPRFDDGIDNMKTTLAIPAAPTEPRAAPFRAGGMGEDSTFQDAGAFLTTVTRMPEIDEISLLRPHVAKREGVAWAVRVDAKALGDLNDPRLRPPPAPDPVAAEMPTRDRAMGLGVLAAAALLYSLLVALKHRDVTRAANERGVQARPLIPLGIALRVAFAGPMLAGGVAWQMLAPQPLGGSLLVLGAMLLTCYVPPRRASQARGPGRWLPLNGRDVLRAQTCSRSWLDASTWPGMLALLIASAGAGVGVWQLSRVAIYHAHLAAIDSVVLLALFGTGLRRWLPGDPMRAASEMLRKLADQLKSLRDAKVAVLGRIPTGASVPDEIRLLVRAKNACRGLIALEVGVGWFQGMGGPIALPQVLLRAAEGSPCHEAITARMRSARWVRGRETHERVLVLTPTLPTADAAARLVRRLAEWVCQESKAAPSPPVKVPRPPRVRSQSRAAASSARMSSGRSASTAKPASEPLPFQDKW